MKLISGNKKHFFDFLDNITKEDNVAVISHTDLDGVASAVIINELLRHKGIETKLFDFINYGKNMFGERIEELNRKRINKIYLLDLSESSDYRDFEIINKKFETFLVDHHPSDNSGRNILRTETADCTAFTLYQLGSEKINLEKWKELICATMIADFSHTKDENFEFIKKVYPSVTKANISDSVPGEFSKDISSALVCFKGKEKKVFDLILEGRTKEFRRYRNAVDKEIHRYIGKYMRDAEFFPEKNLYFYYATPKFDVSSIATTLLSLKQKDRTFLFVSDIKNEKDYVKVSSRNQSGKEDLNLLMKKGIQGLENASAGGHVKASGAKFMKRDIRKFKENIFHC